MRVGVVRKMLDDHLKRLRSSKLLGSLIGPRGGLLRQRRRSGPSNRSPELLKPVFQRFLIGVFQTGGCKSRTRRCSSHIGRIIQWIGRPRRMRVIGITDHQRHPFGRPGGMCKHSRQHETDDNQNTTGHDNPLVFIKCQFNCTRDRFLRVWFFKRRDYTRRP